jgi:sulfide:quinone oxidoreductase
MKNIFDELPKEISRRDMMKLSALMGGSALLNPLQAASNNTKLDPKHKSSAKIVIVGGGDAGITISSRLNNLLEDADITVIDPNATHFYQPGQTLVASGMWNMDDISYELSDVLAKNVKLIRDKATALDPDNNQVTIGSGEVISYDYMVLATGLELNYQGIEGLQRQDLGKNGLTSIYASEGAGQTFGMIKELALKGKKSKIKTIFTHPSTPLKCGGAPKKIMNLTEHYLRTQKARDKAEINFMTPGGKYFGLDPYEDAVKKQFHERGQQAQFHHDLISVDSKNRVATFKHEYEEQGTYDEDLEEYDVITKCKQVEFEYDFLHITPPMKAHDVVKNSPLSWQKGSSGKYGLIEVDSYTLQHKRYPNVFGAGDVIGTKYGKTGGSVRKQAPVVAENIVALIKGKELEEKYDGYTVCPLITGYGSVMLAEFNYEGSTSSFPLDPKEQRWLWWLLKVYALKPMYFQGMLKGRM